MNGSYFDNRELSWLKFNQRVLEEAEDSRVPLFERLRFISIFASNLDEFFMVRVGSLYDQTLLKKEKDKRDNKTHLTAQQQLSLISEKAAELLPRFETAYWQIMEQMKLYGAEHVRAEKLGEADQAYLLKHFVSDIQPLLFPTIVDKRHPMPFFANKAVYVLARLKSKKGNEYFGIIPTRSEVFGRVVTLPGEGFRFLLTEELIAMFAHLAFSDYEILDRGTLRITRNADIDAKEALDDDVDFRDVMEELIKKRRKLCPVRVEYSGYHNKDALAAFAEQAGLSLGKGFLFRMKCPLDFGFLSVLEERLSSEKSLFFDKLVPQPSAMIRADEPMLKQIDRGDILLAYPYEAFSPFIRLLEEAAHTPEVVSIKITLYRVARDSKIVDALIKASENGKEVLALVELRARFDEENNIGWSKRLEEAGVQIIYGLDGLKVHSKLLQITRRIGNSIAYTTQIGTGNYNERTSRLYTDLTLMTADNEIGTDASLVFTALSIGSAVESSSSLWVAPNCLKSRAVELIDREISFGSDGYIGLKLNSLTDRDIIEKLAQASQSGVKVELLIRGISCLIAGIPGETENISLVSVVGRFLEHSRIYIFGKNERERVYISSADFMTRNTERRVEAAAPIKDPALRARITAYFHTMLRDNVKARDQQSDGTYLRREPGDNPQEEPLDAQVYFYRKAYENAEKAARLQLEKGKTLHAKIRRIFKKKEAGKGSVGE